MGLYIANMQKPKFCAECELWGLCFYPKAPKEIKRLQRWVNAKWIFHSTDWEDYGKE